jgi:sugar phosphate isomerase/epimerase
MNTPKTVGDLKTYCDYYNEIGKRCRENGLLYGYHNHSFELQKIEDSVVMLDYMLENTNPEYVFFEMDVYWMVMGKASPVDYFEKYPGRFTVLHIKDHREIGQSGMVGFDAIFRNAATAGMKHMVVEVERYSYDDIEKSIRMSLDYLLRARFVKASYNE